MDSDRPHEPEELDVLLDRLASRAPAFARLSLGDRIALLQRCVGAVAEAAEGWVRSGHRAKGLPADAGEEWLVGPVPTLRNLRLLIQTLRRLERGGTTIDAHRVSTRADGRVEVDVFPGDLKDAVLFPGLRVRQVMQQGETEQSVLEGAGRIHHQAVRPERVAVVLGAGNVSSIPPMDALYKLFGEGFVCLVKLNPVNEWVGPHLERAFAPLVEEGYLHFAYGGADVGRYLVAHPLVQDVHITGSDKTHDAIVWGPAGEEAEKRKASRQPILQKRITSELGNVSPVGIVPARYTTEELGVLARNVAAMVTNNASFNCNAAKMLVLAEAWAQKGVFLNALASVLERVPTRLAYYPGAMERFERLTRGRDVRSIGERTLTKLPWAIVQGLDAQVDEPHFVTEPFCSLLSVVTLPVHDPAAFLEAAAAFMNERLWGSLNAMLVLPPRLERSAGVSAALDTAIEGLRYGTVSVNHWPAVSYALTSPTWGGHPSSSLADIQSGLGWVHNTHLLEGVEKAVLRAPLQLWPKPAWFPDHRTQAELGRRLVRLEASSSWLEVPGLALTALRG